MLPMNHLPSEAQIASWPEPTVSRPWRVLMSGCLWGRPCGVDGTTNGTSPTAERMRSLARVQVVPFCPEDFAFGTPRATPDISGGNGHDVLRGAARVYADTGEDWTEGMVRAAHEMLRVAKENDVLFAMLMDISGACGSTVVYLGPRRNKVYQRGPGVAAALLIENGIPVVSQRDLRTLDRIFVRLDPAHVPSPSARDHHEGEWYRSYFG